MWNGKNIADYVDPEIFARLEQLEKEEEEREARGDYDDEMEEDDEEMEKIRIQAKEIRRRKAVMHEESRVNSTNKPRMARATGRKRDRSESRLRAQMEDLGIDGEELSGKRQARSVTEGSRVREAKAKRQRLISASAGSRVRSSSRVPRDQSGLRDEKMVEKAKKMRKHAQNRMNHQAKKGEADRKILNMKPKHLFAGKRTVGKTARR